MLLRNLDCLNDAGHLTKLGVLFFARDIDFLINHAVVVCVLFKGNERVHILDKKDFKGNIVDNINQAVLFVQRHTNVEYVIERLRRDEIPDIPEVALREAVVNAVCHRDYFDKRANVLIEVFDDRVILSNPGGLPNGLKPSEFGKKSVARNPLIASLLQRIHLIEKVGTGISRIREAVKENGRSEVEFTYDDFFTVTFKRSIEPDGGLNCGLSGGLNGGLNPILKELVDCIKAHPGVNLKQISEMMNRPIDTLDKQVKKLIEEGLIERIGSKKSGGYHVKS
jgi:ATP-dependent DNA helicase RecG